MSRAALHVVHPRPVKQSKPDPAKAVWDGLWWAVTPDCTVTSVDGLRPEDWPPGILFVRPGSMPRHVAARVLEAVAHEIDQTGETH